MGLLSSPLKRVPTSESRALAWEQSATIGQFCEGFDVDLIIRAAVSPSTTGMACGREGVSQK